MKAYAIYRQSPNTGRWFLRSAFHALDEAKLVIAITGSEDRFAIVEHRDLNTWPPDMLQKLPADGKLGLF